MGRFEFQGYSFATAKEMDLAKKEAESIEYIKAKINFNERDKVRKMYDSLVEKQAFITPIGINFMVELYKECSMFSAQSLPGVPVTVPTHLKNPAKGKLTSTMIKGAEQKAETKKEIRDTKLRNARIVIAFLVVIIIGMFGVALSGNSKAFQSEEQKLQDKYATWQQQLEQKEEELNLREQSLN